MNFPSKQKQTGGLYMIHGAALLFGFSGLFGKLIGLPALVIVVGRTSFAALTLVAILIISGIKPFLKHKKDIFVFLILGSILAIHWVTFFHAIQISSVAIGLLTFATFPLFVTLLEPWVFQERLRRLDIVTALVILVGLGLVVPDYNFENQVTKGVFWGIVSGLTFALLSILNRRYVQSYSSLVIAFWQNTFAFLVLVPFGIRAIGVIDSRQIFLLVVLGVFCTAFAHVLFIKSLSQIRTQLASVVAGLEPVYGIILSYFLLDETPAARTLVGGGLILGAVFVATLGRHKKDV